MLHVRRFCPPCAMLAALLTVTPVINTPHAAETEVIEQGHDLYDDLCASCHGRDMVNAGALSFDLRQFPEDDFARFRNSVLNGKNQAMPAWRDKITDDDLAALWAYVRNGR